MTQQRLVPYAAPQPIRCSKCNSVSAVASGKAPPRASVACLLCSAYLCPRCDHHQHAQPDNKKHVRYPVAALKSYIDFNAAKPGESAPRSHLGGQGQALNLTIDGAETPYHTWQRAVRLYPDQPCLGARHMDKMGKVGPYKYDSYKAVNDRVLHLACGLRGLNLASGARIGLYSVNRPEWVIGELACFTNNFVTVPLYDTLGPEAAEQIISQATLSAVICSADKVASLVSIASKHPCLTTIIVMPPQPFEAASASAGAGRSTPTQFVPPSVQLPSHLRIMEMRELEVEGAKGVRTFQPNPPKGSDYATFCYTSGTTGMPKGAMLTHTNFVADMAAVFAHSEKNIINQGEVHISYLPLAHVFERIVLTNVLAAGGAIAFSRGNTLLLLEDIEMARPTIFVGVPRLYNRLYDKVLSQVNSGSPIKRWLFHTAYSQKLANLRSTGTVSHPVWDRLVFSKISAKLGGRVHAMITGSAPIADSVMEFLRICFSCHVLEGYGQTESAAGSTLTTPGDDRSFGNVGSPVCSNLIKLVDVPEMNYTSTDMVNGAPCPRGEVCFKGANIFVGYYKDPEKTKEALDEDGWLHSGDIGMWLPDQTLKLIDRKKNIFKTAQGEYIAPEKIENVYQRCKLVGQAFVHGDSLESTLVAIIVPDEEELDAWAKRMKIPFKSFAELVANPAVKQAVSEEMSAVAKEAGLKGFEQVKSIHLCPEPFSVENDLLTPTFKLKRNVAVKHFAKEIAEMYGKGDNKPATQPIQSKL